MFVSPLAFWEHILIQTWYCKHFFSFKITLWGGGWKGSYCLIYNQAISLRLVSPTELSTRYDRWDNSSTGWLQLESTGLFIWLMRPSRTIVLYHFFNPVLELKCCCTYPYIHVSCLKVIVPYGHDYIQHKTITCVLILIYFWANSANP